MRNWYVANAFKINAQDTDGSQTVFTLDFFRFTRKVLNVHRLWQTLRDVSVSATAHLCDVHSTRNGGSSCHQLQLSIAVFHRFDHRSDIGVKRFFSNEDDATVGHGYRMSLNSATP